MNYRTLIEGDELPFKTGFEPYDPNWVWVAERDGEVVAFLVASPCHRVVMLLRIMATEQAPRFALYGLLNAAFRECIERGFEMGMVFVTDDKPNERHMADMMRAAGCRSEHVIGNWYAGELSRLHHV